MNTIKKIIYTFFCIGILSSCTKDDMEVQKNNDLTWKVDKELVQDDIRTSIGYDPRYNYIGVEKSEQLFTVWTFGDLVLSEEPKQLKVFLDKPAEKEIKLSLDYNPDLYNDLKNQYGGYALGERDLVKILQSEKTISVGETSVNFEIEGNFTDTKKMILPFSLKMQGDDSIRKIKGSDIFVVRVNGGNFFEEELISKASISCEKMAQKIMESHNALARKYPGFYLRNYVRIGKIDNRTGIMFYGNYYSDVYKPASYSEITLEGNILDIKKPTEQSWDWRYFGGEIAPVVNLIINSAPYKIEKASTRGKVKLTSTTDSDIWFILERKID